MPDRCKISPPVIAHLHIFTGRTFPVQQIFLDEILELTEYVMEEDSQYSRKLPKEKRKMDDAAYDADSLDVQLVLADVNINQTSAPKNNVRDEMLSLTQLQQRYSGTLPMSMLAVSVFCVVPPVSKPVGAKRLAPNPA